MDAANTLAKAFLPVLLVSSAACSLVTGSDKLTFTRDPNASGGTSTGGADGSGGDVVGSGGDVVGSGGDISTCSEGVVFADDFETTPTGTGEPINVAGCVVESGVLYGNPEDCIYAYPQDNIINYGDSLIRVAGAVGVTENLSVTRIALNINDDDSGVNGLRIEVNNWNPGGGEVVVAEALDTGGQIKLQLPFAVPADGYVYVEMAVSSGVASLSVAEGGYGSEGGTFLAVSEAFTLDGLAVNSTAYGVVSGYDAITVQTYAYLDNVEVTALCPVVGL
jgi:hypothetical protein